jgi:HSP20 family protein
MQGTKDIQVATTNQRARKEEYVAPQVNIFENKDGYVLEAEMPGVNREGLEITLEGNEIAIVGRRGSDNTPGQALFRERNTSDFRRVFELDPAIDASKVSARMEQGVLTLTLPKSEKVKPRKIRVDD